MKLSAFFLLLISITFLSCKDQPETVDQSEKADELFQEFFQFKQRINPIESTKSGETKFNHVVANYISDNYQEDLITQYSNFLDEIASIDSASVTPSQWLSLRVMKWDCEIKREGLTNSLVTMASPMYDLPSFELMPLIQIQSLHLYFSQLAGGTSVQPFQTVQDYENWLKRVDDYLDFIDTCMGKMKEGMASGVVLPKILTNKMIPQLEGFANDELQDHLFYTPISNVPEGISDDEIKQLVAKYYIMVEEKMKPKFKTLLDFLINEYLPAGRESSGIGALPNGPETYDYLIRLHTTTNMTVDEIHELGLSEVARILTEMEKAKNQLGFEGDIKAFFEFVRSSPEQMPFSDPAEVIANFNEINDKIAGSFDQVFGLKPKANFEVRRTEAFREASASAEYVPGSKDATRSGVFYVPIPDVKAYNKFSDEALFLHEAIPGHHYQLSLQQENQDLPGFLHPESMGVFVEGWALYAESLGSELGLYEDPIQYFGMLSMEMHRAIRLVVDSGIHGKGWTREQAIQYSLDNEAASEESIIAEIERYMATPGQALSYKIGQLKIRELRNRAEEALGDDFDIREYHNQVLNSGSLPMILLEEKIEHWITDELGD